jgi:hypothetical protein
VTLTQSSIVAVHGLGAHPDITWVKKVEKNCDGETQVKEVNWLRDFLPEITPNTRIGSFGYKSQWFGVGAIDTNVSLIAVKLIDELQEWRQVFKAIHFQNSGLTCVGKPLPAFSIYFALLRWACCP